MDDYDFIYFKDLQMCRKCREAAADPPLADGRWMDVWKILAGYHAHDHDANHLKRWHFAPQYDLPRDGFVVILEPEFVRKKNISYSFWS